jgi:hypothetical protein
VFVIQTLFLLECFYYNVHPVAIMGTSVLEKKET